MKRCSEHKREMRAGDSTWCTHCGKTWDTNDRNPPSCDPIPDLNLTGCQPYRDKFKTLMGGRRQGHQQDPTALIGFLAAKLACYEPDSPTVERALEYLKNV